MNREQFDTTRQRIISFVLANVEHSKSAAESEYDIDAVQADIAALADEIRALADCRR